MSTGQDRQSSAIRSSTVRLAWRRIFRSVRAAFDVADMIRHYHPQCGAIGMFQDVVTKSASFRVVTVTLWTCVNLQTLPMAMPLRNDAARSTARSVGNRRSRVAARLRLTCWR